MNMGLEIILIYIVYVYSFVVDSYMYIDDLIHYSYLFPLVAILGSTYTFTVGIDSVDILLLCNPNNDGINLENLMWMTENGVYLQNPVKISEWISIVPQQINHLDCRSVGNVILSVIVNIYGE